MSAPVLFIRSHHAEPEYDALSREGARGSFADQLDNGVLRVINDWDLTVADLSAARGLITTMYLDQIAVLAMSPALEAFLARGGRWVFNGHLARSLVPGLSPFQTITGSNLSAYYLTPLADHPVFEGVDRANFHAMRGVAGFYGRGCNPLPKGATALTGVGPDLLPVDWIWPRPGGGAMLCHAGNDWWGTASDKPSMDRFAANLVAWASHETLQ